ncbi:MAG TPA: hypothetical protein PL061_13420, partial [Syntrophales bacterium]|nr:hypothetical protein [Syntrophales bacterium]
MSASVRSFSCFVVPAPGMVVSIKIHRRDLLQTIFIVCRCWTTKSIDKLLTGPGGAAEDRQHPVVDQAV